MGLKRNTDFHMSIEEIADQLGLEKRQIKNTLD